MSVAAPARAAAPALGAEQLEQLVAPVALYPDSLLSQVLMASTYPLEVVEAGRWRAAQPASLSDTQLAALLQNQSWDPSVQSLTAFPDVLNMMSDKIDWTQQLGDAFLDQQKGLMDAVQRLRIRARDAGHLQSGPQQTVVVASPSVIQIVPAAPEIVYVPVYNPLVVYGPWMYPAYPPFYWHPRAYVPAPGLFISFGTGLVVGHALWGHVDWHRHVVNINVNRYNQFNHVHISHSRWVHDVNHRRGVGYHGASASRYGHSGSQPSRAASREHYRNTANIERQRLNEPHNRQAAEKAASHERGNSHSTRPGGNPGHSGAPGSATGTNHGVTPDRAHGHEAPNSHGAPPHAGMPPHSSAQRPPATHQPAQRPPAPAQHAPAPSAPHGQPQRPPSSSMPHSSAQRPPAPNMAGPHPESHQGPSAAQHGMQGHGAAQRSPQGARGQGHQGDHQGGQQGGQH
jgi:hypothetical protein